MVIYSFQADIIWTCEIIKKKNNKANADFRKYYVVYEKVKSLSGYGGMKIKFMLSWEK